MLEVNEGETVSFAQKQKVLADYLKEQKSQHLKEKEISRRQIHQQKQRENLALKKKFRDGLVYHKAPFKTLNQKIECFNK